MFYNTNIPWLNDNSMSGGCCQCELFPFIGEKSLCHQHRIIICNSPFFYFLCRHIKFTGSCWCICVNKGLKGNPVRNRGYPRSCKSLINYNIQLIGLASPATVCSSNGKALKKDKPEDLPANNHGAFGNKSEDEDFLFCRFYSRYYILKTLNVWQK